MNKETAVEFLLDNMHYSTSTKWQDIIEQAKEMEKKQIMNSWVNGVISDNNMTAEDYYNKTFKN